jgi:hypothetical protein
MMNDQTGTERTPHTDEASDAGATTAGCRDAGSSTAAEVVTVSVPCCGTAGAAKAAGSCCDPAAKTAAVEAGAGCCG